MYIKYFLLVIFLFSCNSTKKELQKSSNNLKSLSKDSFFQLAREGNFTLDENKIELPESLTELKSYINEWHQGDFNQKMNLIVEDSLQSIKFDNDEFFKSYSDEFLSQKLLKEKISYDKFIFEYIMPQLAESIDKSLQVQLKKSNLKDEFNSYLAKYNEIIINQKKNFKLQEYLTSQLVYKYGVIVRDNMQYYQGDLNE